MKIRYRLLVVLLIVGFMGIGTSSSFAQVGDIGRILQSSAEDANILVKQYLKPFGSGFGASLNSGWTNTAQPHKTLGFDITVSAGLAVVPSGDKTFDISNIGLEELEVESGPSTLQTINGKSDVPTTTLAAFEDIDGDGQEEKLFGFNMPSGTGFGYVPAPEIKGAVGIFKDTELMLRYVPKVDISDYGTFKQYGFGAKHGLNQWLPGGKLLPVDLSIMVGYTNQTVSSGFRLTGDEVISSNIQNQVEVPDDITSSTWDGQKVEIDTEAYTINALVGKSLPVISVYGGVGYEASTVSIGTPGAYPLIRNKNNASNPPNSEPQKPLFLDTQEKPIDVEIEGENGIHALAGFRLRFTIFHISASYKLANYSTFNVGAGISFR